MGPAASPLGDMRPSFGWAVVRPALVLGVVPAMLFFNCLLLTLVELPIV